MLFTDFVPDATTRYLYGSVFIALLMLYLAVHLSVISKVSGTNARTSCRRCLAKRRQNKLIKKRKEELKRAKSVEAKLHRKGQKDGVKKWAQLEMSEISERDSSQEVGTEHNNIRDKINCKLVQPDIDLDWLDKLADFDCVPKISVNDSQKKGLLLDLDEGELREEQKEEMLAKLA